MSERIDTPLTNEHFAAFCPVSYTHLSYDVDLTDVVTRIMPTGEDKDGNLLYLPEVYIDSPNQMCIRDRQNRHHAHRRHGHGGHQSVAGL